jgi:hypothetical protein
MPMESSDIYWQAENNYQSIYPNTPSPIVSPFILCLANFELMIVS